VGAKFPSQEFRVRIKKEQDQLTNLRQTRKMSGDSLVLQGSIEVKLNIE
jgi:hypothetical protein